MDNHGFDGATLIDTGLRNGYNMEIALIVLSMTLRIISKKVGDTLGAQMVPEITFALSVLIMSSIGFSLNAHVYTLFF